ncbi:hypothetical protein GURASL_08030 [Geotalea uraniireducens]|uniref:Signal peptidase I n=1 Tax=Geotalea uraniireducens TaxID=351604 RepID=A0ABM8EHH4_9BACT|nr:DUF5684 domain-containing protein [Geotalea uraniireducens]BDV41880.1 hypothetical protein GURASL_08030 [Geotalea uraniireducens]
MKGIWGGGVVLALVLAVLIGTVQIAGAKQVYLKDGGVIDCRSAWRDDGRVQVLVNRDTLVTLGTDEVDLPRTFGRPAAKQLRQKHHRGHHRSAGHGAAAATAADPPPAAGDPAPAGAVVDPATPPVKPEPALASPAVPHVAPSAEPPRQQSQPTVGIPAPAPVPANSIPPNVALFLSTFGTSLVAVLVVLFLFFLAVYWKVYVKAGEPGWSSLIPFYNLFILVKIAGKPWWWFLLLFLPLVNIIVAVLLHLALAARFGKGVLFGLGLAFLGFIFFPILAFGKAEYQPLIPSPAGA